MSHRPLQIEGIGKYLCYHGRLRMNNPAANSKDDKLHICAPFTRSRNSVSIISLSEKFFDGCATVEDLAMSRKDEDDGFGDK